MVVAAFAAMPAVAWQQVGVDCGRLFARGRDLRSVVFDDSTLQTNSVAVVLRFERNISGETINDTVELNGEDCAFLGERFADAHPDEWRSAKIVSRDAGEASPTVSITRRKIGTSIHLAAVR